MFDIPDVARSNYEKGREPKSGMLIQARAILKCSPNRLLGYNDEGMHLALDSLLLKQLKDVFEELMSRASRRPARGLRRLPSWSATRWHGMELRTGS